MTDWNIDVEAARRRIKDKVRKTPIFDVNIDGRDVVLKLEQLQVGGSFKYRGATNAIASLPHGTEHVIASSGGNHGMAVALAAASSGVEAMVVVPRSTPDSKVERIRAAKAEVIIHGSEYADAQQRAHLLASETGAHFIHPFADPDVVAG